MRTRALIVNDEVRAAIAARIALARKHPVPASAFEQLKANEYKTDLTLADRPPDFERPASELVIIPMGYHCAFSFEEQPAGLCRHLSVSVDEAGKLPSPQAVEAIAIEFGFTTPPLKTSLIWTEEFDPGHRAVNLVQVCE
jgi:hypothetical protein